MDLAAVTFHHRLVLIHPFVNGNGRHARAATDLILRSLEQAEFTWGSRGDAIRARENYLRSLREADKGDFDALRQFVRS
jgi:Fic family protein